jgi:hypothetical protein
MRDRTDDKTPSSLLAPQSLRPNISKKRNHNSPNSRQTPPQSKRFCLDESAASSASAPSTQLIDQRRQQSQSLEYEEVTVEFLLSCVLKHLEDRKTKKWEALLQWENEGMSQPSFFPPPPPSKSRLRWNFFNVFLIPCAGYVSSGAQFPLLVDPELYLFYARIDFSKNRTRESQTAETLGDRLYARSLYHLLCDWRLPGPCISMLVDVLASNNYQKRIAEKYNLLNLFFNRPKTKLDMAKVPVSDFFEASCPPISPTKGRCIVPSLREIHFTTSRVRLRLTSPFSSNDVSYQSSNTLQNSTLHLPILSALHTHNSKIINISHMILAS